jgi:hypothetical protein
MNIDDTIFTSRQLFNDLRNCMSDQELIQLATKIRDNMKYEEIEPFYFAECLANHIFEKITL